MEPTTSKERYKALKSELQLHNYRYHVLDAPLVSDAEYDSLLNELKAIEVDHPEWITPDSPTQRAGATPLDKFEKVHHPSPILSLSNAFGPDEARAWLERIKRLDPRVGGAKFVVEPKIDGLTVVLHYREGLFKLGATRGNGEVGEDITSNLRTVRSIPLNIPIDGGGPEPPASLVVRGEAFISIKEFERLNLRLQEAGEKTYLNPRNTAAGSLRQLDPKLTASRPLTLLVYQIVHAEGGKVPTSQWEVLAYLRNLGFPITDIARCFEDFEDTLAYTQSWEKRRDELPYETDGMVIKIDDLGLARDLGFVGKDPRGATAFKFPAREVTTRLRDIRVNVGRTGVLTPYAVLEPVEIGGVVVERATLHNFDFIAEKDIRPGDRVLVKRAGEVIPYVIGPVIEARSGDEQPYIPPTTCPACGGTLEHFPGEVAWYCVNAACPAQLVRNVEHFVSRGAMDIVGLGMKIVEQLIREDLVKDTADLYFLKREQLLALEGFAEKKADNLIDSIELSKNQPLNRLIVALGIRGVGEVAAADLARNFQDLEALSGASQEDLQTIEGFGPNTAAAILDWFSRPANQKVLEKLHRAGVWPVAETGEDTSTEAVFSGMTFVVTGTLGGFTRDEVKAFIETHGGKITSSLSKNTTYLVLGENPGSKLAKAQELGVEIIREGELMDLVKKSS
jgi:DNA ligase (NAD+)